MPNETEHATTCAPNAPHITGPATYTNATVKPSSITSAAPSSPPSKTNPDRGERSYSTNSNIVGRIIKL